MTYRLRNVAIAVGLAFVAMLLTLFYVTNYRRSVQHQQATVQVYVAARNITPGTSGSALAHNGALKSVSVTRSSVVPGAISNPSEVANLVLTQPLFAGEQVTLRRFTDVQAEGIVGQLKGPMRAVQLAGDPNQLLAGTLKAGDHVDLVANITLDSNGSTNTTTVHATRIVLRDIPVLQTNGPSSSSSAPIAQQNSVILEVSDTQVQRLFFVEKNDDWTLELRPAIDAADSPDRIDTVLTVVGTGVRG
jgi:Flp pilus assembly protein CpaB